MLLNEKLNDLSLSWNRPFLVPGTREMCCVIYTYHFRGRQYTELGLARYQNGSWRFTRRIPKNAAPVAWQYLSALPETCRVFTVPLPPEEHQKDHLSAP